MSFVGLEGEVLAGKYRVEKVLGKGGMGIVFGARHLVMDERVAIKLLSEELVGTPEFVERFINEARNASKLRSDHVVRVTDVDTLNSGVPYMVMEYMEGLDLSMVLTQRGMLRIRESVDYVLQACDAIAEAHALGIIHRDLKPANLFLTRTRDGQPRVKVLDFGISKRVIEGDDGGLTRPAAALGTRAYMSPEQSLSTKTADSRTDIWALGCILYKLTTGAVPFRAQNGNDVQYSIFYEEPRPASELRPEIPASLDAIILRCLEKLPEKRYATVGGLMDALRRVLTELAESPAPAVGSAPAEGVTPAAEAPSLSPPAPSEPPLAPPVEPSPSEKHSNVAKGTLSAVKPSVSPAPAPARGGANTSEGPSQLTRTTLTNVSDVSADNSARKTRAGLIASTALGAAALLLSASGVIYLLQREPPPPTSASDSVTAALDVPQEAAPTAPPEVPSAEPAVADTSAPHDPPVASAAPAASGPIAVPTSRANGGPSSSALQKTHAQAVTESSAPAPPPPPPPPPPAPSSKPPCMDKICPE